MHLYYNEWDAPTAAWLRKLGDEGYLPPGHVDTRSIRDVRADDIAGYDQCHFFAGIGGWPLALRWAGLENVSGIWTGSPPCQPFSIAGKGLAQSDERHLAPVWLDLIKECRPRLIFGEQVADAIKSGWLDDLFNALEGEGYTCGAAVLPACSVGAPHIRKRLFFGAIRLADANKKQCGRLTASQRYISDRETPGRLESYGVSEPDMSACRLADADSNRRKPGRAIRPICTKHDAEYGGSAGGLANPDSTRLEGVRTDLDPQGRQGQDFRPVRLSSVVRDRTEPANPHNGFWDGADWLGCRDSKFRPVEPGTQPLASRILGRVGRLRGYGNAIVPQVGAVFIEEFIGAVLDLGGE